ncbi:MAG: pyruvate dehydrogenase complex dihydrolipoamide acetyltransferase [Anaerolineales bacterium]
MAETINMPKLGFDMAEGLLVRWVKQVGEQINKGEILAEIETDKATVEVESSASGVVLQHVVEQGSIVPINAPIAVIGNAGEAVSPIVASPIANSGQSSAIGEAKVEGQKSSTTAPATTRLSDDAAIKASPLAKKIAREKKVDLSNVKGTGPGGRIVRRDIEKLVASHQSSVASRQSPVISPEDKTTSTTKLRQAIGRRLVESKTTIPHFYVSHEYKMEALMEMRKQINAVLPDGEKISVNDFIVKAVALSLRQFPNLNAALRGAEIVQFGQVNVGVAVTVPGGLMTVVVKDADAKTLRQISSEIKAMAARAREGKVKPEDVDGSTFSTSNLGMYDVENFTAIINPPEAAILAISSAREVPVVENGAIKTGWRMKATISVDHRISDGAEAAQFMQKLAEFLETPIKMLA